MTGRVLIEVEVPGGNIGALVLTMDLERMDWSEYLEPLASLVAAAHPDAQWTATPISDEMSDREAISGHAR